MKNLILKLFIGVFIFCAIAFAVQGNFYSNYSSAKFAGDEMNCEFLKDSFKICSSENGKNEEPNENNDKSFESVENEFIENIDETFLYGGVEEKETDTVPSRNYTVVIDPGHGGTDPGSIGYKTKVHESKLNLEISLLLKDKLEKAGINVVMTREDENGLAEGKGKAFKKEDMRLRKELIKKVRPNMVISIHQNSYTNHILRGAQVFYDKTSDVSKKIAEFIQEQFLQGLEHSNKTTSPGDYFMLKCTYAPSVIVECGFLSNEKEEKLLLSKEYQEKIVDCVYKGIVKYLQINN